MEYITTNVPAQFSALVSKNKRLISIAIASDNNNDDGNDAKDNK